MLQSPWKELLRMRNKILIIEDDLDLCEALAESFEDEGYEVNHAQNGAFGKNELEKGGYDFLILDIKIPGLNGFEILEWLNKTGNNIKTIVLTGMPLHEEITKYLNEDSPKEAELLQFADRVLNKPVKTQRLIDTLREL